MKKVCSLKCVRKGCQMEKQYKVWGRNWNNERRLNLLRSTYSFYRELTVRKVLQNKDAFSLFESRLDIIIYRLGWVNSIQEGRQLISHKHIMVNGKCVVWSGYMVEPSDIITIKSLSMKYSIAKTLTKRLLELRSLTPEKRKPWLVPPYLKLNYGILEAKLIEKPQLKDLSFPCQDFEQMNLAVGKYLY